MKIGLVNLGTSHPSASLPLVRAWGHEVAIGGDSGEWLPFYTPLVTDRTVVHLQPDPARLYQELLEPELLAPAGLQARAAGGATLSPGDSTPARAFDGEAFTRLDRKAKYAS